MSTTVPFTPRLSSRTSLSSSHRHNNNGLGGGGGSELTRTEIANIASTLASVRKVRPGQILEELEMSIDEEDEFSAGFSAGAGAGARGPSLGDRKHQQTEISRNGENRRERTRDRDVTNTTTRRQGHEGGLLAPTSSHAKASTSKSTRLETTSAAAGDVSYHADETSFRDRPLNSRVASSSTTGSAAASRFSSVAAVTATARRTNNSNNVSVGRPPVSTRHNVVNNGGSTSSASSSRAPGAGAAAAAASSSSRTRPATSLGHVHGLDSREREGLPRERERESGRERERETMSHASNLSRPRSAAELRRGHGDDKNNDVRNDANADADEDEDDDDDTIPQPELNGGTSTDVRNLLSGVPVKVQEAWICEDLGFVLQGVEGELIRYTSTYDNLDPSQRLRGASWTIDHGLDGSLLSVLKRLLPMATYYMAIQTFVEMRNATEYGMVNHALASGVREILKDYHHLTTRLESLYISNSDFTLQTAYLYLHPTLHTLSLLCSLCLSLEYEDEDDENSEEDDEDDEDNAALAKELGLTNFGAKGFEDPEASDVKGHILGGEVLGILAIRAAQMSG